MSETPKSPGDLIRAELERRGWTHDDLARILGRHRPEITSLIQGKRNITPEIAVDLADALGQPPEFWLGAETARQLSMVRSDGSVARRARLYAIAPVKDMERRGWLPPTEDAAQLEAALCGFFGVANVDQEIDLPVAARKSDKVSPMTVEQKAWVFQAKRMAETLVVKAFDPARLDELERRLRELAAYPDEARHIPEVLGEFGIRFVVIEPLAGGSIDGASFWLDEAKPVIAISGRIDRIDAIWFTICHELKHIRHRDGFSMDVELFGARSRAPAELKDEAERRADYEAAEMLLPHAVLDSFVQRVGPLYSKTRIIQFANRHRVHPGIVVGQLQHRGEIGYSANREMLVRMRERLLPTAIVDGWGRVDRV